ncbi:DUF2510 domain-containing protein [Microterricola pindariensis]|uniref:DUF2510 domain-containing protein n=1 Tax=Microterricola pindariensis TaxID=478010 RepID=A0ABX5AUT3_9MICO|nr:DUF2510 domain-containing protein [Microterricola pindariensis]PPL18648.1 hypothetical protein GY24_10240 [Microterricola pindariensis]
MSDQMIPAGWYADPNDASKLRWWDGTNWLDYFAPAAPPAPVVVRPVGPAVNIAAPVLSDPPAAVEVLDADPALDPQVSPSFLSHAKNLTTGLPGLAVGPLAAGVAMASAALGAQAEKSSSAVAVAPAVPPAAPAEIVAIAPSAPAAPEAIPASAPARTLLDHAADLVGDHRVQGGAMGAAGAALAAGGAASLIRKEGAGRRASKIFLIGLIIFVVGVFGLIGGISEALTGPSEVTTSGEVTKIQSKPLGGCIPTVEFQVQGQTYTTRPSKFETCVWEVGDTTSVSYTASSGGTIARLGTSTSTASAIPGSIMLMLAGLIVSAWALIPIAIRAGSIVGGAYLIRQGLRRSKTQADAASPDQTAD